MKDMMSYKGYYGSVHCSDDDRVFFDKLEYIRGLINYEGATVEGLKLYFEEAVDDYLALCQEEGIEPEQPFKGSIAVKATIAPGKVSVDFLKR